jgi:regulator of RNase E activity RraA
LRRQSRRSKPWPLQRAATRRSDDLPRRFAKIYTAAITDVMDEMGLLRQTLPWTIEPLSPEMRLAGYAFPARGRPRKQGPRDEVIRRFLTMIGDVPRDSVLVIQANDNVAAHFGELSAESLRARRVRGAVVDGSTRDAAYIRRIGFPTFVRFHTPQDSVPRWQVSDWGQPITIGGVRIALGDVIVGDFDGVVVVPRRVAHEVLLRCEKLVGTENKVRTAVKRGMLPLAAYEKYGAF